ncbi:MAG: hypothetical protein KAF24_00870 [Nitrosopumilaceae archaeon]|nr:hypothetical protein [Nitrosopumilaceae archaeon]
MLITELIHCGISPWEVEVLYEILSTKFSVSTKEIKTDDDFLSKIDLIIPIAFHDFFDWFGLRYWDKMKFIFKEMKRRRGKNNTIKIIIGFINSMKIRFILDTLDVNKFNIAVDKINFILELLPYHLDVEKFPNDVIEMQYIFDDHENRWIANAVTPKKTFSFIDKSWKSLG